MRTMLIFFLTGLFPLAALAGMDHSMHRAGSSGGNTAGTCLKAKLSKFFPEHLATVSPESEISFVVINIASPDQVAVTVKGIKVPITAEYKEPYYLVKAKLPAELRGTAARVNVSVSAKATHCEAEEGWLLKISG